MITTLQEVLSKNPLLFGACIIFSSIVSSGSLSTVTYGSLASEAYVDDKISNLRHRIDYQTGRNAKALLNQEIFALEIVEKQTPELFTPAHAKRLLHLLSQRDEINLQLLESRKALNSIN